MLKGRKREFLEKEKEKKEI